MSKVMLKEIVLVLVLVVLEMQILLILQISVRGNSETATKLKTARNIKLQGAVAGNANFDGGGNITISTAQNNIFVLSGNITLSNGSGSTSIAYPNGYNASNCVVISIGASRTDDNCLEYGHVASSFIMGVYLKNSGMSITAYSPEKVGPSKAIPYKLVLMKIN